MSGWDKTQGKIIRKNVSEEEMWAIFNYIFSIRCMKRNTYKFAILKSILDNLFNTTIVNDMRFISYIDLFEKFSNNYWNLIAKYNIRQMRKDGKSELSHIERIIHSVITRNPEVINLEFDSLNDIDKKYIIKEATKSCKRNVFGALYDDTEGCFFEFDIFGDGIYINECYYKFMLQNKYVLEKLNYYGWAKFVERINDDVSIVRLLEKLELATPKRSDLSIYRDILKIEFGQKNCFYCGKELGSISHVDHFLPWVFIKDDKLWNFVLSCPTCNNKKKEQLPNMNDLESILIRNEQLREINNVLIQKDFNDYNEEFIRQLYKYAHRCGFKCRQ